MSFEIVSEGTGGCIRFVEIMLQHENISTWNFSNTILLLLVCFKVMCFEIRISAIALNVGLGRIFGYGGLIQPDIWPNPIYMWYCVHYRYTLLMFPKSRLLWSEIVYNDSLSLRAVIKRVPDLSKISGLIFWNIFPRPAVGRPHDMFKVYEFRHIHIVISLYL